MIMRREHKSKTKIYLGYLTEILNYHLHFDFTVSHPSFFCPAVTDVDVSNCIRSQECWPRHNFGDNYGGASVSPLWTSWPWLSLMSLISFWFSAFLAGENCYNEVNIIVRQCPVCQSLCSGGVVQPLSVSRSSHHHHYHQFRPPYFFTQNQVWI